MCQNRVLLNIQTMRNHHQKEEKMTKRIFTQNHLENFEYHGNTVVEHTREKAGKIGWRDWIIFNSVEEAQEFFKENCNV